MVNLRLPNIQGANERERLKEMQSYLYQLVEQLQIALNTIESTPSNSSPVQSQMPVRIIQSSPVAMMSLDDGMTTDQATFQAIKPLIIKSADIINAYYEEINRRLESIYVAQSDFGMFMEETSQEISETSTDITRAFSNIQTIVSEIGTIDTNVKSLATNIDTIDTTFQENIQNVEKKIEDTKADIGSELKTVEESVGTLDTEVKSVKEGVQEVEQKAQTLEGNVQTIATDVGTLDTSISEVDKSVQAVDKNLWDLDNKLDDAKTGLDTSLGKLSGDLGKLDSGVKDLKKNVDTELKDVKSSLGKISQALIEVNANIKSGLLYYDENEIPVYGLEVGQRTTVNGVEVFNKFARFTSDRLSFYDQNSIEVAYISDRKLYINNVEITVSLKIGGLVDTVMANGDVVEKWVGRR